MARYDLSEAEWRIVEPLLPPPGRGKARVDDRRVVNAIFYVLRIGSPSRDLPDRYGPYTTRRHALRQTRPQLPRRHSARLNPHLAARC